MARPSPKTRMLLAILASAALLLGCTGASAAPTPAPATPAPAPTAAPTPQPTAAPTPAPTATGAAPTPTPAASPASTPTPAPQLASVSIRGFAFNPSSLTVKVGTTVTWTNADSVAHTVTGDSGGIPTSPVIPPGGTFSFTFTVPGTYAYHCTPHPAMHGTVTVTQ